MFDDTVAIILCLATIIASLSGLLYYILKELRRIKRLLVRTMETTKYPKEEDNDASDS